MKRTLRVAFYLLFPLCLAVPAGAEVTDAEVKEVARELACLCGTCPRRPLHECSCGWADKYRARIKGALEAGQDKPAIVASFVREFGQEAFSAPPKSGFNLTAWVMPFLALALGGLAVRTVMVTWSRDRRVPAPSAASQDEGDGTYLTRLEQELKERDP